MKLNLGCAESCLPGITLEEKLQACKKHRLWIELIHKGERDLDVLSSYDVDVKTVQAYLLHKLSIIGRERAERRAAYEHVKSTIETASNVGAEYVLTVPSYGYEFADNPREECAEAFRDIAAIAGEYGVKVLIEALSPRRTSFLPSLAEVSSFIASLDLENTALAADTCHAYDAGEDVLVLKSQVKELHLKDSRGRPPGKGALDFAPILKGHPWPQLCLEYRSDDEEEALAQALACLNSI